MGFETPGGSGLEVRITAVSAPNIDKFSYLILKREFSIDRHHRNRMETSLTAGGGNDFSNSHGNGSLHDFCGSIPFLHWEERIRPLPARGSGATYPRHGPSAFQQCDDYSCRTESS